MIMPPGTVQVKCSYCGGLILVPPWMGGKTLRCEDHPERLAVGMCNDCGRNFCGECLHIYHLKTEDTEAILYLDTACLRRRRAEKANEAVLGGILLLIFGIFSSLVSLIIGTVTIILGGGIVAYGIRKSKETPTESTVDAILGERRQMEADPKLKEAADAEKLYNELRTHYVNHWGPRTGIDLLQNEIRAYMRQGVSFPEAVRKLHGRARKL